MRRAALFALLAVVAVPAVARADVDLLSQAKVRITGARAGDRAGAQVAAAGDVNGDGRPDLLVSAPSAGLGARTQSGLVYVVFGGSSPREVDLANLGDGGFVVQGPGPGERVGYAVAAAGDVNGDGLGDIIIGDSAWNPFKEGIPSGRAFVVFGKKDAGSVDLAALGVGGFEIQGRRDSEAGATVAGLGDVNGDGLADVALSGYSLIGPGAFVVYGHQGNRAVSLQQLGSDGWVINGSGLRGAAGDVNGDGLGDVIVSGNSPTNRQPQASIYIVFGGARSTPVDTAALGDAGISIAPPSAFTDLFDATGVGDANGDGLADVALAMPRSADHGVLTGAAWVVLGRHDPGLITLGADDTTYRIVGASGSQRFLQPGDRTAAGLAGGADLNGDGLSDIVLGAPGASSSGRPQSGAAWAVFGQREPTTVDLATSSGVAARVAGPAAYARAGAHVAALAGFAASGAGAIAVGVPDASPKGRTGAGEVTIASLGSGPSLQAEGGNARVAGLVSVGDQGIVLDGDLVLWKTAAYDASPGRLLVRNDGTNAVRQLPMDSHCRPVDLAHGLALVSCFRPSQSGSVVTGPDCQALVVVVRTAKTIAVPNSCKPPPGYQDIPTYDYIGRYWLVGGLSCYRCESTLVYLNWHTGALRTEGDEESGAPARDIDRPDLPLVDPRSHRHPAVSVSTAIGAPLVLIIHGKRTKLAACDAEQCDQATVSNGRVVWLTGTTVHGYVIATRKRATWTVPRLDPFQFGPIPVSDTPPNISARWTRRHIYVSAVYPGSTVELFVGNWSAAR
jgi:hypothetical protein